MVSQKDLENYVGVELQEARVACPLKVGHVQYDEGQMYRVWASGELRESKTKKVLELNGA